MKKQNNTLIVVVAVIMVTILVIGMFAMLRKDNNDTPRHIADYSANNSLLERLQTEIAEGKYDKKKNEQTKDTTA